MVHCGFESCLAVDIAYTFPGHLNGIDRESGSCQIRPSPQHQQSTIQQTWLQVRATYSQGTVAEPRGRHRWAAVQEADRSRVPEEDAGGHLQEDDRCVTHDDV